MRPLLLFLACLAAGTPSAAAAPAASVRVVDKLPNSGRNAYYQGNRAPLELMGEGFTGHLSEISPFSKLEVNAYNLGHVLKDGRILGEARRWLDAVLASQRPDGWFGAKSRLEGGRISDAAAHGWQLSMRGKVPDLWPDVVMLYPLRSYYEATGDKRILRTKQAAAAPGSKENLR